MSFLSLAQAIHHPSCPPSFLAAAQTRLPSHVGVDQLRFTPNAFIAYYQEDSGQNADRAAKATTILGCPTCLDVNTPGKTAQQDRLGNPLASGKPLLRASEAAPGQSFPGIIAANLWYCPDCKLPISTLLPRFGQ